MNENFELNKIINQIVEIDLKTINGIKNYGYVLAPELINQIDQIKTVNSTHEIVKIFDEVMDVLQTEQQPELVIFFDQFKIRYTYLDTIKQALDASVTNYQQETGKTLTWPEAFTTFYIGFFYFQIRKFSEDFLRYVNNETFLNNWNTTFYETLTEELNAIILAKDVIGQLELIEAWITKYLDPEILFNLIDFNFEENIKEKENFINKFTEFKLALQTIDLIVDLMAKEVKEGEDHE